jgi:hypothetical protein
MTDHTGIRLTDVGLHSTDKNRRGHPLTQLINLGDIEIVDSPAQSKHAGGTYRVIRPPGPRRSQLNADVRRLIEWIYSWPNTTTQRIASAKKSVAYALALELTDNTSDGKVTSVVKDVVSKDGKTRTSRETVPNPAGQSITRILVYEKQ